MESMHKKRIRLGPKGSRGFTLIELLITIGILAILVALALPGYQHFVRKSNRGEAQQLMMNYANLEEIWRANHNTYGTSADLDLPTHDLYDFYVRGSGNTCGNADPTATAYVVVACPKGPQAVDKERGVACSPLTLDHANAKSPAECW